MCLLGNGSPCWAEGHCRGARHLPAGFYGASAVGSCQVVLGALFLEFSVRFCGCRLVRVPGKLGVKLFRGPTFNMRAQPGVGTGLRLQSYSQIPRSPLRRPITNTQQEPTDLCGCAPETGKQRDEDTSSRH